MPVAMEMTYDDSSGVGLDEYHRIVDELGAHPGGPHPDPGCLFHWVAQQDGKLRAVDVWESREKFERYLQDRLMPIISELGITGRPEISFTEVAAYHTAGR